MAAKDMAPPNDSEAIRLGIANACLMMPGTAEKRAEEMNRLYHLQDREKEMIAEAKEEAGVGEHVKRLHKVFGIAKATVQIMKILDKVKAPGDRAAILTQVGVLSKSVGYLEKDLVTLAQEAEASAGQQADDQGSVFDKTSEGQRRGGAAAQPKPAETKADGLPPHKPTPGIPLHEAQAQLETYLKANPPKRGAKPAERKRLEAQVEAAKAAEADAGPAAPEGEAQPEGSAESGAEEPVEKPEAAPGEISQSIREGNAEADAFLHEQEQKRAANDQAPSKGAQKAAVPDLDDDLPPPAPRRRAAGQPLPNAGGQGSYTYN